MLIVFHNTETKRAHKKLLGLLGVFMRTFSNSHYLSSLLFLSILFSNTSYPMEKKKLNKERQKFYKDIVAKTDEHISQTECRLP